MEIGCYPLFATLVDTARQLLTVNGHTMRSVAPVSLEAEHAYQNVLGTSDRLVGKKNVVALCKKYVVVLCKKYVVVLCKKHVVVFM